MPQAIRVIDSFSDLSGTASRSQLAAESLARYQVATMLCRTQDGNAMQGGSLPPANEFSVAINGWGIGTMVLRGQEAKGNTKTSTLAFEFALPVEYIADGNVRLVIHAQYAGDGEPGTKTIDAEVRELADDGTASGDLCVTAAQTVTGSWADYIFTITDTNLTGGDRLMVLVRTVIQETGNSEEVHAEIGSIEFQLDVRG